MIRRKLKWTTSTSFHPGINQNVQILKDNYPSEINKLSFSDSYTENKIAINKTPAFLRWRLSNPREKYICFIHHDNAEIDSYIILSSGNTHSHVFDYGQKKGVFGVPEIIKSILSHAGFGTITIVDAGIPQDLKAFLVKQHFYTFPLIDRIRQKESYNIPIIIRPTIENYSDNDWFIDNIDARDIGNWHITDFCFD